MIPTRVLLSWLAAMVLSGAWQAAFAASINFLESGEWHAISADGVSAALTPNAGAPQAQTPVAAALRLDFDFANHGGYTGVHRQLPVDFPDNFVVTLRLRGRANANNLEIKFIDDSGDNVWWINRRDFHFTGDWQTLTFKRRHVDFAWGPAKDHTLRHTAAVELILSAGSGGAGQLEVYAFSLTAVPPAAATTMPVATASSALPGAPPAYALDGNPGTAWRSDPAAGAAQWLQLDLGGAREFGGLTLRWLSNLRPSDYEVQALDDEDHWLSLRRVSGGVGKLDRLYLPESETRMLRLLLHAGSARGYGLAEAHLEELSFGASINGYFTQLARSSQRGDYPRGYYSEQSYWTVVGNSGGHESGLLSEDGGFELRYGGPTIEPWLLVDGRAYGWAQVQSAHSLPEGYLPMPRVRWQAAPFRLDIEAYARGAPGNEHAMLEYHYRNATSHPQILTFALLVRPFQVNPPTQFLNGGGGTSAIHEARWNGMDLLLNGATAVTPLTRPSDFAFGSFDAGALPRQLLVRAGHTGVELHDDFGYGSVALRYRLRIAPYASALFAVDLPWSGSPRAPFANTTALTPWLTATRTEVADHWRTALNRVSIDGPLATQPLADTLRSALAQVLMNRNGPAIQPGTRSYRRSWIRDGALSSAALLALGHDDAVREFIDWYAPHVYASGKVPCCVDARGADPVPENDSHGELLFLAAEYFRYTHDQAWLMALWPTLQRVAAYLETLRQSERSSAQQLAATRRYFGLLPRSISHEGYSAKPMHSYWDDFWALKGFDDALRMADWLDDSAARARLAPQAGEFRQDLYASLLASSSALGIDYLPGAADIGDFDATSTTIALSPQGEAAWLPATLMRGTFERYWREFTARRDGDQTWNTYTPYEIRNVGAMLRLGWPERARMALSWFMRDRRPAGWNQWAEVVGRDAREPRFVGDMPHGWVASDFIRSALDLYAYEREGDQSLVLAAGVDADWLGGAGIGINRLRTPYGELSYHLRRSRGTLLLRCAGLTATPPGGLILLIAGRELRLPATSGDWLIDASDHFTAHTP